MDYAIVEIAGKQVIVEPNKKVKVPYLGEVTKFESDKVILIAEKGKVSLGTPFLKDKLKFDVTGDQSYKLRVAFHKPKANHRKVVGQKTLFSMIKLAA